MRFRGVDYTKFIAKIWSNGSNSKIWAVNALKNINQPPKACTSLRMVYIITSKTNNTRGHTYNDDKKDCIFICNWLHCIAQPSEKIDGFWARKPVDPFIGHVPHFHWHCNHIKHCWNKSRMISTYSMYLLYSYARSIGNFVCYVAISLRKTSRLHLHP